MTKGITYYKLEAPYEGDVTKNCALTGTEVDNNFFTLEGRDVKSLSVEEGDIILTLLNGDTIKAKEVFNNFITNLQFDDKTGVLTIYRNNGDTEEIPGFGIVVEKEEEENKHEHEHKHPHHFRPQPIKREKIATDFTLKGDGTIENPLTLTETVKTGQFKPVDRIAEVVEDECGCHCRKPSQPKVGERVVVTEEFTPYGLLYDFRTTAQIACELDKSHSKWRIPSKEDWDDMLNAIEPDSYDKNHNEGIPNKYLGKWAGKLLKSKDYWKLDACGCEEEDIFEEGYCDCFESDNSCKTKYFGEHGHWHNKPNSEYSKGVDKYGFCILPSGYADDGGHTLYFGERAGFWTSTNIHFSNIINKRFEYNKTKVHQDVIAGQNYMSIRLIKDYNGTNFTETEEILGQTYPTVLMPSEKHGSAVWTSINLYYTTPQCKGLKPNGGKDLLYTTKYFIDEWDGHKWLRNELVEGDSFVVKEAPNNRKDIEYRIIDGKIVDTTVQIHDSVFDDLKPIIDELDERFTKEAEKLQSEIDETNKKIQSEQINRETVEGQIWEAINNESAAREKVDNEQWEAINNEIARAQEVEGQIWNAISDVNNAQKEVDKQIWEAINNESAAREKVDNEQWSVINQEIEIREKVDNEQWEAINNEIARAQEVEGQIKEDLTQETEQRTKEDKKLEEQLLINEGSGFDGDTGILTLKSKGGENDIKVQFTLKLGTF